MLLAVNYHYIGDEGAHRRGIHPISKERFARQLDLLGGNFSFVSQEDVLDAVRGGRPLPARACLITFDDGLRSQYEAGLPILREKKIPAVFFVNGKPYAEGLPLLVHKIHWCRAYLDPDTFLRKIGEQYAYFTGKTFDIDRLDVSPEELRIHYHYDSPADAKVKYVLDRGFGEPAVRENVINRVFGELVPDERAFSRSFYMELKQLKELHDAGYLGLHTYSHKPLAMYSASVCREEIEKCLEIMPELLGAARPKIWSVSYPYGNAQIIPSFITETVRAAGLALGFTMERSFNQTLTQPLLLARIDTNDAPGGRAPCFEMRDGAAVMMSSAMRSSRTEHFVEP